MVVQKDQIEGMLSILSPSLNPSRRGREVKFNILGFVDDQVVLFFLQHQPDFADKLRPGRLDGQDMTLLKKSC